MKKILGLDLGTNSIGWALVELDENDKPCKIKGLGSRIIPMGAELSKFEQGQAQTKNANRRIARGLRKLNKRYKQRRNKLIYALQQLNMLPDQIQLTEEFINPNRVDRISIKPIQKHQKQLTAFELLELRVKALKEAIPLKDFGRIIYLFNQLRGYAGGNVEPEKEDTSDEEQDEKKARKENLVILSKILFISEPEEIIYKGKKIKKRKIHLEIDDDRINEIKIEGDTFLENLKENETIELLISISNTKRGITYFIKLPNKTSWRKKMENLEKQLKDKSKELGREVYLSEYFLEILKENKWAKIRNNVILRSRYESEFEAIWNSQYEKNPEFKILVDDKNLLEKIVSFIFPERDHSKLENEDTLKSKKEFYRKKALENGLEYLIKKQIIFYQRELKDQTHLISDCRFESNEKVVSRSHPIFQEYRIWEQINKLHINTKVEKGKNKKGETKYTYIDRPIPASIKEWIYDELQNKKEIGFHSIKNKLIKENNLIEGTEFLNGLDPKAKIKTNETKYLLKKSLKEWWTKLELDKEENLISIWDILYNVKGNEYDIESPRTSAILQFIKKSTETNLDVNDLAISISKIKFSRNYSSLSLKAIVKILPLVKAGKYFKSDFSNALNDKIVKLLNEEVSDPFEKAAQEYLENNIDLLVEGGLINAYATMLVYIRHTAKEYSQEELINDFNHIARLKPGELRNPLAEQIINETLFLIKDIWKQFGEKPSEIRLELARELKNSAERRKKIYKTQTSNQKENERIKERLQDLEEEITQANIEKYKLWASQENLQEEYLKEYKDPSKSEIEKMRLWEEQGHISPYTGNVIPMSDLFNKGKFDVDHIIPRSRYFDDSFTNKVICETDVNKEKGNRTAMEYFETGSKISSVRNKEVFISEVNRMFSGLKRKNLLATKIPNDPILRQIKDTQYIATRTKEELNKIVGNNYVKTTTGGITDYLRNQWGLTDKFKNQLKTRYEILLNSEKYLVDEFNNYIKSKKAKQEEYEKIGKEFKDVVLDKERFIDLLKQNSIRIKNNKLIIKDWTKRIDHRHHAIDALVVACTEPAHVKRLNDLNKELQDWLDEHKQELLPDFEGTPSELLDEIMNLGETQRLMITQQLEKFSNIPAPWKGFDIDAKEAIENIIVSQKPKDKLLIQRGIDGKLQLKIRGQLHEGTHYGKSQNSECYRIPLEKLASKNFATEKTIEKVTNKFLKETLREHLKSCDNKKEDAFSREGIIALNNKLAERKKLKNGVQVPAPHTPISSVKIFYRDPSKLRIKKGQEEPDETLQRLDRAKAFNNSLFVKTGDNYLFAVMEKEILEKKTKESITIRVFDIITFFNAVNLLKTEFNSAINKNEFNKELVFKQYFEIRKNAKLLFTLKQGDMVYMPEKSQEVILDYESPLYKDFWENYKERSKNIYVVQKFSGSQIYFLKHNIAKSIKKGIEFGSQDCYEKIGERSIKDHCIKLQVDRLGNIKPF
jgi:CRISPR/Cas system Type II protein with McrA/HNH and RuvC-like nuclease domain